MLDDNPRLGRAARSAMKSATRTFVSAATVWELTIKTMLGKLSIPHDFQTRLDDEGLTLVSITAEHATSIRDFPELVKHDPFDRLILAQANCEGLRLLTADRVLLSLGRPEVLDATR